MRFVLGAKIITVIAIAPPVFPTVVVPPPGSYIWCGL